MRAMPEFQLKRFFNQAAAATARANLSPSFAEPLRTSDLLALEPGAAERYADLPLGYTTAFGGDELRAAIAARYASIAPEEVVAACGGDDALPSLFMALLQPGDHVIVHSPVYQPLASVATWCGADVTLWTGEEEAAWEPPLASLARLVRPETRMIVVNFPHSPTGFVPDRAYLEQLVALADDAGALLISDEIYRGLPLTASAEPPSVVDLSARAVALNSVSKTYGSAGATRRLAGDAQCGGARCGAGVPHALEYLRRRAGRVPRRARHSPGRPYPCHASRACANQPRLAG